MFGIGLVEFLILVVIALIVFGPERLPEAAKKAATTIRQLRRMADNARNDLADELGPEFRDLDLNDLRNPRRAVQKYVLDGIDEDDLRVDRDLDIRKDLDDLDAEDDDDSARSRSRRNGNGSDHGERKGPRQLNGSRNSDDADADASDGPDVSEASDGRTVVEDEGPGTSGTTTSTSAERTEGVLEEAGEDRTTLTLTENERPPFDPDAT